MAIEFLQAQKKQRYLVLILTFAICITLLVVWFGFFRNSVPAVPVSAPVAQPKIEINWNLLGDAKLKALKAFEQAPALEKAPGRKNPFTTY